MDEATLAKIRNGRTLFVRKEAARIRRELERYVDQVDAVGIPVPLEAHRSLSGCFAYLRAIERGDPLE